MTNTKRAMVLVGLLSITATTTVSAAGTGNDILILDEAALSNATGRENLQEQKSDVSQGATLTDNQLTAGETGSNVISSSAFSNLQGISHVIQNTGNNVIIQDSTTFNVQFIPSSVN